MATFRMVHTEFWSDPRVVEEMTPEDKFFFLYLLTNPNTTQIGIYQITKKQVAFEMGYSLESVNSLFQRFIEHHKIIRYNEATREIAIKNWGRYNLRRGGKPMLDCVKSELKHVKDIELIDYVSMAIERHEIKGLYDTYTIRGQEEEEEKEKEEEEERDSVASAPIRDLFDHYISKNIIRHTKITAAMKTAVNARLKDYTYEQLVQAIDNYAIVYSSNDYWFDTKYTFADLMRDKDVRKFIDDAEPLKNFANRKGVNHAKDQRRHGQATGTNYEDVLAASERGKRAWGG